jgi:hypothetical protein
LGYEPIPKRLKAKGYVKTVPLSKEMEVLVARPFKFFPALVVCKSDMYGKIYALLCLLFKLSLNKIDPNNSFQSPNTWRHWEALFISPVLSIFRSIICSHTIYI